MPIVMYYLRREQVVTGVPEWWTSTGWVKDKSLAEAIELSRMDASVQSQGYWFRVTVEVETQRGK